MGDGSSIRVTGYTARGWQVSMTLCAGATPETVATLLRMVDVLEAQGVMPTAPAEGQTRETVAVVVRREASNGAPVVDFYPAWNANGSYGVHRVGYMYLDTPDDVAQFEAQSGLRLADMPVYPAQAPLQRKHGKQHKCEVGVLTAFEIIRTPKEPDDQGRPRYAYSYAAPKAVAPALMSAQSASPAPTPSPEEPAWDVAAWEKAVLDAGLNRQAVIGMVHRGSMEAFYRDPAMEARAWQALKDALEPPQPLTTGRARPMPGKPFHPWHEDGRKIDDLVARAKQDGFILPGDGLPALEAVAGVSARECATGKLFYERVIAGAARMGGGANE